MTIEWLMVIAFLAATLFAVGRYLRSVAAWCGLVGFFGVAITAAAWWQVELRHKARERSNFAEKVPEKGRPGGYVSSDKCRSCHPQQYASWHDSYHRTMTQLPTRETVRGRFDKVTLQMGGDAYHLERTGDEFWVDMIDPDWRYVRTLQRAAYEEGRAANPPIAEPNPPRARKRITMLTGSHHMQAYWVAGDFGNMQFSFPFTYLFEDERWVPRNDVFLFDPKAHYTHQVWNVGCIGCHATAGQPRQDPQTRIIQSRTAELGIACEACHGPADEHIRRNVVPSRRYIGRRAARGDATIFNPARKDHVKSSESCGQCHAIRSNQQQEEWKVHGTQFRPGENLDAKAPLVRYDGIDLNTPGHEKKRALMEGSFWSDGQVRVSGREFNGLIESGCFKRGELSCISCHSMHRYQDRADQLGARMESNQSCLQCHTSLANQIEQHTHHRAGSNGSQCYNCHMPHTTYGLLKAIRSHTIDSPSVKASVATGRPNACNLCHLDQTLDWTARKLNEWFQQPVPRLNEEQRSVSAAVSWLLKGDAGQRALVAWHFGWEPARNTSGESWFAPHLGQLLEDPYSAVRYVAQRSLKRLPGFADFTYDYIEPAAKRATSRERALDVWRTTKVRAPANHQAVLLQADGSLQEDKVSDLLKHRNDRRMELLE
jgi:hypothetical protein